MLVLLGISLTLAVLLRTQAPLASATFVRYAHQLCIDACPKSIHREFLNAIVCGEPLAGGSSIALFKSDFVKTGLIHLLVVSGSHLICLEEVAGKFRIASCPKLLRSAAVFSTLLVFTLMTSASPPVLRSMIQWCLRKLSARERWNWTRIQLLTVSGSIALIFCKDSWALKSLFLSWIASLGLSWVSSHWQHSFTQKIWVSVKMNAGVYLTLCPALLPLGVPHPFSILCNSIFAPVMGLLLFPISMLGFIWSGFGQLADWAWSITLWAIAQTAQQIPFAFAKMALSQLVLVPYIGLLTLWFCFARRHHRHSKLAHKTKTTFFLLALVLSAPMSLAKADELIVWNVGQGSWATLINSDSCQHFDVGGERAPLKSIGLACSGKGNRAYYSHWDWDHIEQTKAAQNLLLDFCVAVSPGGETDSEAKRKMLAAAPVCTHSAAVPEIFLSQRSPSSGHLGSGRSGSGSRAKRGAKRRSKRGANELSRVFVFRKVIFPGDSPTSAEKIWGRSALLSSARILIAGHHGSKTATSQDLLAHARNLKMIIVSARKLRYGHPHPSMLARARMAGLPVLTTEDWGHLHIDLSTEGRRL